MDFAYFEESPMAARARLAGFSDALTRGAEGGAEGGDGGGWEAEIDEEARKLEKELDAELKELLDSDGDVLTF